MVCGVPPPALRAQVRLDLRLQVHLHHSQPSSECSAAEATLIMCWLSIEPRPAGPSGNTAEPTLRSSGHGALTLRAKRQGDQARVTLTGFAGSAPSAERARIGSTKGLLRAAGARLALDTERGRGHVGALSPRAGSPPSPSGGRSVGAGGLVQAPSGGEPWALRYAPCRALRQMAEHRSVPLMQLGSRKARCLGTEKTLYQ